ncbi:MAG: class I tRNA ligase family protein, partial [Rhodospirillaceae bacterium]|nr:class I tRNA ligase family protein [Rhodospirillaceae bacterium]
GFLSVNGEKMSKSLGNFITIRQALEGAPGEVLRLMMLSTHYRKPLDWTDDGVEQARTRLDRLYRILSKADGLSEARQVAKSLDGDKFSNAILDDLNTPLALSELERRADDLSKMSAQELQQSLPGFLANADLLGILQKEPEAWFKGGEAESDVGQIEAQIALRLAARKAKDFAAADNIRDALAENGIILEDRPDGSTDWRRAG